MSPRSGSGKDPAVSERVVNKRAWNVAPLIDVVLADEDQVDRDPEATERPPQADILSVAIR